MEGIIGGRLFLLAVFVLHLFLCYGCRNVYSVINRKVLNGVFTAELILITAFVIYDNIRALPQDWFLAIVGYILVYGIIVTTWLAYSDYTLLEKEKIYLMSIKSKVSFLDTDYYQGVVVAGKHKVSVLLPYDEKCLIAELQKVKFEKILNGHYIVSAV